ncbi:MAG: hypothetical protein ABW003_15495 [Microvirga sp.]
MLGKTSSLTVIFLLAITVAAAAGGPSQDQAERAIVELMRQRKVNRNLKVDRLHACYPQAKRNEWLCLVEAKGRDGKPMIQELVFRSSAQQWVIDPDAETDLLCPSQDVAQAALQAIRKDTGLKITEDANSGVLSDTRGLLQDEKGPMRLACTYEVETGQGRELVVTAYSSYQDDRYVFDPELDIIPK